MKYILIILITTDVFAGVENLFRDLKTDLIKFSECRLDMIWNDYSWDQLDKIYFSSQQYEKTFLFDFKNQINIPMAYEDTPSFAFSTYGHEVINSENILSYNLDDWNTQKLVTKDYLLSLMFHENFHFFGQSRIHANTVTRADIYPYQESPRIYRAMVILNLLNTLNDPSKASLYLSQAKYWNKKHQFEFETDYHEINQLDMIEGSAEYVEIFSKILLQADCHFSKEIFDSILAKRKKWNRYFSTSEKDGQAYIGGMLAYFIDYTLFNKTKSLDIKTEQGHYPIEVLLEGYSPIASEVDKELFNLISGDIDKKNQHIKVIIDEYNFNQNQGAKLILISDDNIKVQGSYRVESFIRLREELYGFYEIYEGFSGLFKGKKSMIQLKGVHSFMSYEKKCGEHQHGFWINDPKFKVEEIIDFKSENIQIQTSSFTVDGNTICIK